MRKKVIGILSRALILKEIKLYNFYKHLKVSNKIFRDAKNLKTFLILFKLINITI